MFLHDNEEKFRELIQAVSSETGVDEPIIEKDYWVALFLRRLSEKEPRLVFKGGTSLSKCFRIIERFSEDIDVNVDQTEKLTEGGRRRFKQAVIDTVADLGLTLTNPDAVRSRRDFNRYQIDYASLFEGIVIKEHLYLESAFRIGAFPTERMNTASLIYDYLKTNGHDGVIEQYGLEPFPVTVQTLERTFIDKLFALCDYVLDGRITEHSRHLYDLHMIKNHVKIDKKFRALFEEVRRAREGQVGCLSAEPNIQIPKLLRGIIKDEVYRYDYEHITTSLLYDKVPYEVAVKSLAKIISELDSAMEM
ncbi:hypothetical protein FACS1894211_09530 [Clostridia bacterium]|nr:hypothetical protein FACS1894211_09530 [Clostridia bacterium]